MQINVLLSLSVSFCFHTKIKAYEQQFLLLGGNEVPRAGIYPKPIILCLSEVAKWWPEDSIWPARVCHWPMQCFSFNWISLQHSKFKKFHIKNPDFQIFLEKTDLGTPGSHSSQITVASSRGGLALELTTLGLSSLMASVSSCRHVILHPEDLKVSFGKHLWRGKVQQRTWEEQK